MIKTVPQAIKRYMSVIEEIDLLPKSESSKYDIFLKKGYSFNEDWAWSGVDGRPCQRSYLADNVADAVHQLRDVNQCDCEACKKAHGGKCPRP